MTILIDEPRWWFRGRRWSHLVSDASYAELHRFTEALGIPRRAFQGDHYDVPEEHYDQMVAAGAAPTPSRELLRRLKAGGLRLSPEQRRLRDSPPLTTAATTRQPTLSRLAIDSARRG